MLVDPGLTFFPNKIHSGPIIVKGAPMQHVSHSDIGHGTEIAGKVNTAITEMTNDVHHVLQIGKDALGSVASKIGILVDDKLRELNEGLQPAREKWGQLVGGSQLGRGVLQTAGVVTVSGIAGGDRLVRG